LADWRKLKKNYSLPNRVVLELFQAPGAKLVGGKQKLEVLRIEAWMKRLAIAGYLIAPQTVLSIQ
jgi:hypothetical protein